MPYSSYDHDKLEAAETMRIERRIYFEAKDREIAPYASLPIAQLLSMRSESAAAEQAIFDDLKERAAAWEEQAGRTLLLDKTLEYVRTPHVQHTANEWQTTEHNRHIRSNRVYQMNYYIYENTRYDKEAQKSIPYSWTLTWSVRTNSPSRTQAKIAGQDRKVFTDKAAMEKYLNGRIKAYDRLFTEISPPIPQEYADYFKVNGMLMPDYTIEGEEPPQQQQAAAIPENTGQEKEREHMSEQFSIMIGNRSRFDAGDPGGYWLDMPATKEQLHEAMRNVGITADNPQDFSIRGYSDDPEKHIALPYEMVCAFDGHNVVARDEREVLPGKEEDVLLPFGEDVRLLGFPLLPRKRHDVEAVHGEAEARRRFEAEEYILILRQGKGGREMARQPVRVYREARGGNDPFLLCLKREGEWQFRSCNHRASAPRL